MADRIKIYGTVWCPDCARARQVFNRCQVQYDWLDIEQDPTAADYVVKINHGSRRVPSIVFPDGTFLVEPGDSELARKLNEIKL